MKNTVAFSVHLLTASGAVFALFAMLSAGNNHWSIMFLWLLGALIVDGIDGPLSRYFQVKKYAGNWDGEVMDLIVDYLTYVFIPAYAIAKSGLLGEWQGWLAAIVITVTGVVYFADTRMKTADNSFSGFPGCWNMVILVLFALWPPAWVSISVIAILALGQFFDLKFVHPVRTQRWRPLSMTMMVVWTVAALWVGWLDFQPTDFARGALIISSIYLLFAGIAQQLTPVRT